MSYGRFSLQLTIVKPSRPAIKGHLDATASASMLAFWQRIARSGTLIKQRVYNKVIGYILCIFPCHAHISVICGTFCGRMMTEGSNAFA